MKKAALKAISKDVHKGKAVFSIFPGLCKGCGLCREKCPEGALSWSEELGVYGTPTVIPDPEKCKACRTCERVCPDCAIAITRKTGEDKD
ncbi:MAG TPA: 4Fe-4S binding protein [Syntrophaceticus sp.]|nr:4Fe-4S binding protein [Syntrophaceticus sp.]